MEVGIGIKPVSYLGTERLIHTAIDYAIKHKRKSVTLVHKGNIMKFTEGAFRDWGYKVAKERLRRGRNRRRPLVQNPRRQTRRGHRHQGRHRRHHPAAGADPPGGFRRDRHAESQRRLSLSDALAAQVGGIGIAPGGNINYVTGHAVFEATHGTAPKYANQDVVNPGSVILSGVMMFEYMGWQEAADLIVKGLEDAIAAKTVTYDFARQMEGATKVKCSEFGTAMIRHMS